MFFSAACSSAIRPSDRLLRDSGRLSVSTAMLPTVSRSSTGDGGMVARAVWLVITLSIWGAFHPNVTSGERRGRADRMALAKMSVAELEVVLVREFPRAFGSGDPRIERADGET